MKARKILGIYRHPRFSNNAVEADRLILEEAIAEWKRVSPEALEVEMCEEAELVSTKGRFDLVLTMAQAEESLQAIEEAFPHTLVCNSPRAIRNCYRKKMSTILSEKNVNYVPFQLLLTDGSQNPELEAGESYWMKRSDFHAICDDDVTLAESPEELAAKLAAFQQRNVREVILQKHIHGDIYKFYGVKGKFFRPIRVRKLLDESGTTPNFATLEKFASASAEALELLVYGGDAILDSQGKFHLIDVNDWPSFRICRDEAAKAIAQLCVAQLQTVAKETPRSAAFAATRA